MTNWQENRIQSAIEGTNPMVMADTRSFAYAISETNFQDKSHSSKAWRRYNDSVNAYTTKHAF